MSEQAKTVATLRVGGVPEHFNFPWHSGQASDAFADAGLTVDWRECPGGTGEMVRGLQNDELDLALLLSEGAVRAVSEDRGIKLLQWYVYSPLIWGVHVPAGCTAQEFDDLQGSPFLISREGSGSHLMAYVAASRAEWPPGELKFDLVGNLDGARSAMREPQTMGFLWEKYTTQPFVDQGEMRRIDECPTPWPAFVLAVSERALARQHEAIESLCSLIPEICRQVRRDPGLAAVLAARYGLKEDAVKEWLGQTSWAERANLDEPTLQNIIDTLAELELLGKAITPADCMGR